MENIELTVGDYTGVLYGVSSMIVKCTDGWSMHTGFCNIKSKEEFEEFLKGMPKFRKTLEEAKEKQE